MSNTSNSTFDINALLDGKLDDIADLPEFKPFPPGLYVVTLTAEMKEINKHPAIQVQMKMVDVKELGSGVSVDSTPLVGAVSSVAYMLDNEFGAGNFKKILIAAHEKFGDKTNRELIGDLQNAEVTVVTDLRQDKTDKEKFYQQIVEIAFN